MGVHTLTINNASGHSPITTLKNTSKFQLTESISTVTTDSKSTPKAPDHFHSAELDDLSNSPTQPLSPSPSPQTQSNRKKALNSHTNLNRPFSCAKEATL